MPRLDPKLSNLFGYVEPIECFTMSRPVSVALNGSTAESRGVSSTGSRRGRTDWAVGSCTSRWTTWRPWRARSSSWTGRKGFEAFLLKVSAWRELFISIQSLLLIADGGQLVGVQLVELLQDLDAVQVQFGVNTNNKAWSRAAGFPLRLSVSSIKCVYADYLIGSLARKN